MNAESSIRRDRLIPFCLDKSFLPGLRSNPLALFEPVERRIPISPTRSFNRIDLSAHTLMVSAGSDRSTSFCRWDPTPFGENRRRCWRSEKRREFARLWSVFTTLSQSNAVVAIDGEPGFDRHLVGQRRVSLLPDRPDQPSIEGLVGNPGLSRLAAVGGHLRDVGAERANAFNAAWAPSDILP